MKAMAHCYLIIAALLLASLPMIAQVNFGFTLNSNLITASWNGPNEIDFGRLIKGSEAIAEINLSNSIMLEIVAPRDYDLIISLDQVVELAGPEPPDKLPFVLNWAYYNLGGQPDATAARSQALQIPTGFFSATLPVVRRQSGQPAPPPTPPHGGYSLPTEKVFLYFYGKAGPAAPTLNSGTYGATININIDYASYE